MCMCYLLQNSCALGKLIFVSDLILLCITRTKKLRETLVAVQQLDKNMSSLRSWLAHIETELSRPIVYDTCNFQEIQRKLDLQQVELHMT